MSAVERLEDRRDETPPQRDLADAATSSIEVASSIEAALTPSPAERSARLRPLLALAPYVARYRGRAALALVALTIAAITTLLVPVAVRRMIDFGFTPEGIARINSYFSVMIAVVAVLALASASRFYLVMTIGERIVADLRRDVFAHLISLSPAFFDSARSGELISRLTADTTQIKSAVGASVSIALRNVMLFIGATAMMVITSPQAFRPRAAGDSGDRAAAGGVRALGAAAVAQRAGHAGGRHRLCLRTGRRDPHRAGLYRRAAGQCALRRRSRAGL